MIVDRLRPELRRAHFPDGKMAMGLEVRSKVPPANSAHTKHKHGTTEGYVRRPSSRLELGHKRRAARGLRIEIRAAAKIFSSVGIDMSIAFRSINLSQISHPSTGKRITHDISLEANLITRNFLTPFEDIAAKLDTSKPVTRNNCSNLQA
ncbi:hypothetical protein TWF481_007117 [Arthrobotrys musiformis]|uniref:Uncharacterized protein n=1 Tax=Arthrobotrys musiformis TaxID=47236 RepID=A0AAV9WCU1_9PEZI